jgi:hypothetical protein
VVGAARLGGPTGPWRLRLRRRGDELLLVLRVGDPQSVSDRHRLAVEATALQLAERYHIAAPGVECAGQKVVPAISQKRQTPSQRLVP